MERVELTRPMALNALNALPDMMAVAERYEGAAPSGDSPIDRFAGLALYTQARGELDSTSRSHGFDGYGDWITVLQNLMMAHAHAQVGDQMQAMGPAMQQMLQQLRNNPQIPEAQKQMMLQQMGQMPGMMQTNAPSQNNLDIALELGPQIEAVMNAVR